MMKWSEFQSIIQFYAAADFAVIAIGEFMRKNNDNIAGSIQSNHKWALDFSGRVTDLLTDCIKYRNRDGLSEAKELNKNLINILAEIKEGMEICSSYVVRYMVREKFNNIFSIFLGVCYIIALVYSSFNPDSKINNISAWIVSVFGFFPILFQIIIIWIASKASKKIVREFLPEWNFLSLSYTIKWSDISQQNRDIRMSRFDVEEAKKEPT